jgi:hypothetical protein
LTRPLRRPSILLLATAAACAGDGGRLVVQAVSEQTGEPRAGVRVQVDEQAWATTDAEGKAWFDPVAGRFTVRLATSYPAPAGEAHEARVVRGRSGREVVVEIGSPAGVGDWHHARASGTVAGRSGAASGSVVHVGFTPFRDWSASTVAGDDGAFEMDLGWKGPSDASSASLSLYAWESDGTDPPGRYHGFARSGRLALVERETVTVPLTLGPVTQHTVEGDVSLPGAAAGVSTVLWLAMSPYEQLRLAGSETVGAGSFAWVVPTVADGQTWIGVWNGARWHHRRVDGGARGRLAFAPPASPELLEPAAGATVAPATVFRWTAPAAGGAATLLLDCRSGATSYFRYLVDAEGVEAALPASPGFEVPAGATCEWAVKWCADSDRAVEERCAWSSGRDVAF